jgi:hypothetical protein
MQRQRCPSTRIARAGAAGLLRPHRDRANLAAAVIAASDTTPPPRRLLLGSDAYEAVHASLTARLDEVDAQRQHASITDHT